MIIDNLQNIERYMVLHPLFAQVVEFLRTVDLQTCPLERIVLKDDELVVNITETAPKGKEEALLETHNDFIDIQIPVSGPEIMGYASRMVLPEVYYDKEKDISFYDTSVENYLKVSPGMFVIFFPQDAHAPAITPITLKKVIIKIKV